MTNGDVGEHFRGALRDQCLRTPTTTGVRNVACFRGREDTERERQTMRMPQRFDAPEGREQYGQRFGTVEPVLATSATTNGSIALRCVVAAE